MPETECPKRIRRLFDWEIDEAKLVFADRLRYNRVRVHECAEWPDTIYWLGKRLRGLSPPAKDEHNAITLGNNCFFPLPLPERPSSPGDPFGMGWLIHELTHAWQFQTIGWLYLIRAVLAQLTSRPYDFGGEAGLRAMREKNGTLLSFNAEQQGAITGTYYVHLKGGHDVSAWDPYIQDIRAA
jgi:hypothetical protein